MLTTDRPGVFRGRRFNAHSWYVIDPAESSELEHAWRSLYADTYSSPRRQAWAVTVAWVVAVTVVVGGVLCAALLSESSPALAALPPIASLFVAPFLAFASYRAISPAPNYTIREAPSGVAGIYAHIAEWADDQTPRELLWTVNSAVGRMWFLTEATYTLSAKHPTWNEVVRHAPALGTIPTELAGALAAARTELVALAEVHGFTYNDADFAMHGDY